MAPMGKTEVAVDPWTGALRGARIGLWNGLSGARIDNGHKRPKPTYDRAEPGSLPTPLATRNNPRSDPTRAKPPEQEVRLSR